MGDSEFNTNKIMENPARFDLDKGISSWRRQLQEAMALNHEEIEELETHLRDSVSRWEKAGLAPEEAFWIARRRMGGADELADEFRKVNPERVWLSRGLWVIGGFVVIQAVLALSSFASMAAVIGANALIRRGFDVGLITWAGRKFFEDPSRANSFTIGTVSTLAYLAVIAVLGFLIWRGSREKGFFNRFARWMQGHPVLGTVTALLVSACCQLSSWAAFPLLFRMVGPTDYGTIAYFRTFTIIGVSLGWPLLLGWLLMRLSRHEQIRN